jgi:3',5'-cyclic-AMP phosphodiesterase
MSAVTRREALVAGAALAALPLAARADDSFSFVHLTDTHIQPERHAADGCAACFEQINRVNPDFAIVGGDLVFDAVEVGAARAKQVFDLWKKAARNLQAPLHYVIGNHDVFGTKTSSGVSRDDPGYGKHMYEDLVGRRFYAFEQRGWRFIVLDSIAITPDGSYVGRIDEEQIAWLAAELRTLSKSQPLVVATHIPLATAFPRFIELPVPIEMMTVTNGRDVLDMLWPYNLKAVLQGHTHISEVVRYRGCQFITSGAVCGNWWKGPRNGNPEGFGVVTIRNGELSWEYRTYGFVADPA